jgi:LuxR family maltose regulon positive regulatory protein
MLERLIRLNLFISPLDEARNWFRYHRLFADLLQVLLRQDKPGDLPRLLRTAADWFERNGWMEEAVKHRIQAGDFEQAAQLLESSAEDMLVRGATATLHRRLDSLPAAVLEAHPLLCIHQAWMHMLNGRAAAEVEERLQASGRHPIDASMESKLKAVRALLSYFRHETQLAIRLAEEALEGLREDNVFLWSIAGLSLSTSRLEEGDLGGGLKILSEVARKTEEAGNPMIASLALAGTTRLLIRQGRLHQAYSLCRHALDQAGSRGGKPVPTDGVILIALAEIQRGWNDLENAEEAIRRAIPLVRRWTEARLVDANLILSRIRLARGDESGAQAALSEAEKAAGRTRLTMIDDLSVAVLRVQMQIRRREFGPVERWIREREVDRDRGPGHVLKRGTPDDLHLRKYEHLPWRGTTSPGGRV